MPHEPIPESRGIQDEWLVRTREAVIPRVVLDEFLARAPGATAPWLPRIASTFLQWVRIEGRHPDVHCLPSLAVLTLWQAFADFDSAWAEFGRVVELSLGPAPAALTVDRDGLFYAFIHALADEGAFYIPVLFSIDEECGIVGGARYRPTCLVDDCRSTPGITCLHMWRDERPAWW